MLRPGHRGPACGRMPSDSQALAALGTAGIDDLAAVLGAHTGQKPVHLLALALLGLESSLHSRFLLKSCPRSAGSGMSVLRPCDTPCTARAKGTGLRFNSISHGFAFCQAFFRFPSKIFCAKFFNIFTFSGGKPRRTQYFGGMRPAGHNIARGYEPRPDGPYWLHYINRGLDSGRLRRFVLY